MHKARTTMYVVRTTNNWCNQDNYFKNMYITYMYIIIIIMVNYTRIPHDAPYVYSMHVWKITIEVYTKWTLLKQVTMVTKNLEITENQVSRVKGEEKGSFEQWWGMLRERVKGERNNKIVYS